MQARRAAPRERLLDSDVDALLNADDLEVDYRVDLLSDDDNPVEDITDDVAVDGSVLWNGTDDLQRRCSLKISRDLAWDSDRLRPTLLLASRTEQISAGFHLGVFLITRPKLTVRDARFADGRRAEAHECSGWDKLRLLRSPIGRSWATAWDDGQFTTVADEIRRLLAASPWTGRFVIAPQLEQVLLTQPWVWPHDGTGTQWLRPLIDITKAGGADRPWVDETGALQFQLLRDHLTREVDWVLDAQDPRTIVGPERTLVQDLSLLPNSWSFRAQNWPRTPVEGDGIYTPAPNTSNGPASIAGRRRVVWNENQVLDAATQEALVAQGDDIRARDLRALGGRELTTGPLPLLGHDDLLSLPDTALRPEAPARALASTWTQYLDGRDCAITAAEVAA